jgi:septum formation protein
MLVLASQSPRRKEILENAGFKPVIRVSGVPEKWAAGESPRDYVVRLARAKAEAVERNAGEVVLGADTVVVLEGEVLEKPDSAAVAEKMIAKLSGREHVVITGICLRADASTITDAAATVVQFAALTPSEIIGYAYSGEPMDKAGAYAIQGLASKFIERIEGCYFNVMGLPVSLFYQHFKTVSGDNF